MAFVNQTRNTIYLNIEPQPKLIRPLLDEATQRWVRSIPGCSVTDGKKKIVLRQYRMVEADFAKWCKENPDPLWDKLDNKSKFNRKNERTDFPARAQIILPVWSYADSDVKIVKQGSQFYEEMIKYDSQGGKATACDWICWTEGADFNKHYLTARQDQSPFNWPADSQVIMAKAKKMFEQSIADLFPFKDEAEMITFIHGESKEETNSLGGSSVQVPANYTPGGQSGVSLGAAVPPMQTPVMAQPTMNWQQMPQSAPTPMQQPQQQVVPQTSWAGPQAQPAMGMTTTAAPAGYVPQMMPGQQTYTPGQMPGHPGPQGFGQQNFNMPQQPQMQQPQMWNPQAQGYPTQQPPRDETPNAPVASQPVFAPPPPPAQPVQQPVQVTANNGNPADIQINFGKHAGKTLGWLRDNEPSYLNFLKGNKPEYRSAIEQVLSGMQQPAQQPSPQVQGVPQTTMNPDQEIQRAALARECNQRLLSIEEFKGQGIMQKMMPFLKDTIGTTNFNEATLDQLLKLKSAIDARGVN